MPIVPQRVPQSQKTSTQATLEAQTTIQPKPQEPKANQQTWTKRYIGNSGSISFTLIIKRYADGKLSGNYSVSGGSSKTWPLEGMLQKDNTFSLKGTENEAVFEGHVGLGAYTIFATFRNKKFKIDRI